MENNLLTCKNCKQSKPVEEFGLDRSRKTGRHPYCKVCRRAHSVKRYAENPEPTREAQRGRYAANTETMREAQRWRTLKYQYGLTRDDWNRMYESQEGKCGICRKDLPDKINTRGEMRNSACVDHDHETGVVRGILCHDCNLGIGYLKHDEDLLRAAIAYLK